MMNGDRIRKNLKIHLNDNPKLEGLEAFRRCLERDYFSRVSVRNCSASKWQDPSLDSQWNLVIDMECNFDLVEILYHLEKGCWGHRDEIKELLESHFSSPLSAALHTLKEQNSVPVDVEELSFLLKDTSIVIKRIV